MPIEGWRRVRQQASQEVRDYMDRTAIQRPFCDNCGSLIVGIPLHSGNNGKPYYCTFCKNAGDVKEAKALVAPEGDVKMPMGDMEIEPKQRFECKCGEKFPTTDDLMKHKAEGLCNAYKEDAPDLVVTREQVKEIEREGRERLPFSCDQCDKSFLTEASVVAHKHSVHSSSRGDYECPKCSKPFTVIGWLENHMKKVHKMSASEVRDALKREGIGSKVKPREVVDMDRIERHEMERASAASSAAEGMGTVEPELKRKVQVPSPDEVEDIGWEEIEKAAADLLDAQRVCSPCGIAFFPTQAIPKFCPMCGWRTMPSKAEIVQEAVEEVEKEVFTRAAVMDAVLSRKHRKNMSSGIVSKQLSLMVRMGELEVVPNHGRERAYRRARG